jgi:hypothetical protein
MKNNKLNTIEAEKLKIEVLNNITSKNIVGGKVGNTVCIHFDY